MFTNVNARRILRYAVNAVRSKVKRPMNYTNVTSRGINICSKQLKFINEMEK